MLAVQPELRGLLSTCPEEHLAADGPRITGPFHLLQDTAHDTFALALGIDLRVVEEVDPVIVGDPHQCFGGVVRDLLAEGEPGAEGQLGELEARGA